MLLTQLFYIGSNILSTYTHATLASPPQSNVCSGKHLAFLGIQRSPNGTVCISILQLC